MLSWIVTFPLPWKLLDLFGTFVTLCKQPLVCLWWLEYVIWIATLYGYIIFILLYSNLLLRYSGVCAQLTISPVCLSSLSSESGAFLSGSLLTEFIAIRNYHTGGISALDGVFVHVDEVCFWWFTMSCCLAFPSVHFYLIH